MARTGRPKRSIKDLPNNWEKLLISQATNGASESELRVVLGCISDDLWYRLIADNKDFSRAVSQSKLLSQSWWERKGRENIDNNKFNTRLWNINMMNRFKWNLNNTNDNQIENCYKCVTTAIKNEYQI